MNAFFQATNIDPNEIVKELNLFYESLRGRVYKENGSKVEPDRVDYGAKYLFEAAAVLRKANNDADLSKRIQEASSRCHSMLLEAAVQVGKRLPVDKDVFKPLAFLHPSSVLSQVGRASLLQLPMEHLIEADMSTLDDQYRKILLINWASDASFKDGVPNDAVEFWSVVYEHQNMLGNRPFAELATYALACLTTPTSNAVIERIFSHVTNVKTKPRNQMSSRMLEAIVRIRTNLHFRGKCCKDFVPTENMFKLFNTSNMYKKSTEENEECDEELDLAQF